MSEETKLDLTKPVQTRDGREAEIYWYDDVQIHGWFLNNVGQRIAATWNTDTGRIGVFAQETQFDLVNVLEKEPELDTTNLPEGWRAEFRGSGWDNDGKACYYSTTFKDEPAGKIEFSASQIQLLAAGSSWHYYWELIPPEEPKKTLKETLALLPEPYATRAISQIDRDYVKSEGWVDEGSLEFAIGVFNNWPKTREGFTFWKTVESAIDGDAIDESKLPCMLDQREKEARESVPDGWRVVGRGKYEGLFEESRGLKYFNLRSDAKPTWHEKTCEGCSTNHLYAARIEEKSKRIPYTCETWPLWATRIRVRLNTYHEPIGRVVFTGVTDGSSNVIDYEELANYYEIAGPNHDWEPASQEVEGGEDESG